MKTAVVTGTNRGIGLELVKQLLDSNYIVHATYRNEDDELAIISNKNLHTHRLDVRDAEALSDLSKLVGPIDLLINNAGIADGRWSSISEIDMEHALEVLNVNSISPVLVTQKLLPNLKDNGSSTVVMVSSLMGSISDCFSGKSYAYRASKTALNMFAVAMKNELAEIGCSVLILHPGWVETDMGGPNAPLNVVESVNGIIARIDEQNMSQTGRYVQYDGTPIEW